MGDFVVRDWMSNPVTTVPHDARLLDAALTLRRTGYRHLAIVNGEMLVGVITDRDVHRYAPSILGNISQDDYNAIFENTPLERVMTRNPITVEPTTPVRDAVKLMHDRKLGCLPVVEGGRLVGILTTSDLLGLLHKIITGEVPAGAR
ncbi:MAG TPA: CBS domain-containing protein [Candidatus Acidoferrales bacterium]